MYVELTEGATWTLTADSYISSLTCDADSIDLNGYTLYVNGEAYEAGTASEGEAIVVEVSEDSGRDMGEPPEGMGEPPEGMGEPPAGGKPGNGSTPPAKPGSN